MSKSKNSKSLFSLFRYRRNPILGCSMVVVNCFLLISSCTYYSYTIPNQEERYIKNGRIKFAIDVEGIVLKGPDKFAQYKTDTSKDYYQLSVFFSDSVNSNGVIRMEADSVMIILQEPYSSFEFKLPDIGTEKVGEWWVTDIMPLPLPKKYESDFDIKFELKIYNDDTGELLEMLPLSVHCKWTRHFYTIFNPPYG